MTSYLGIYHSQGIRRVVTVTSEIGQVKLVDGYSLEVYTLRGKVFLGAYRATRWVFGAEMNPSHVTYSYGAKGFSFASFSTEADAREWAETVV
jgi:hypothetical protein